MKNSKEIVIRSKSLAKLTLPGNLEIPKYAGPIINLANRFGRATRPEKVGSLAILARGKLNKGIIYWEKWYKNKYPDIIDKATDEAFAKLKEIKRSLRNVDREIVKKWVEDLIIRKTFNGLKLQEKIIMEVAKKVRRKYRRPTKLEESRGIDGWIGGKSVSVKAKSYRTEGFLPEEIEANAMIYYSKTKNGIKIKYDDIWSK
jgi:hypothetical protein